MMEGWSGAGLLSTGTILESVCNSLAEEKGKDDIFGLIIKGLKCSWLACSG